MSKIVGCREGEYAENRVPVLSNVFDIPRRLKEISEDYFVMFNTVSQRFEVHDRTQMPLTLACMLPYDELDARALEYVREHHVSRLETIIAEIDRHNEQLEIDAHKAHMSLANDKMKDALKYLNNHDELPEELNR